MTGTHSISVPSNPVGRSQGHEPGAAAKFKSLYKRTVIYTLGLNLDWRVFAVLWTDFEGR
jgi:hypothetical protein